ncbi:hypothetical protein BBBOND_0403420 [Babesia bigemina]|uniref:Uncharacterized protein n=1 Tax=Babesia bigemina TaxID=5866 RepID=A0A061DE09_BABBI|nr:hypothetical protein BBBOND_0403420 [Babesia bigemina]CDR97854.1 hypothetical protein BBBOND_0403420 [Babesia bigemina]|eukprot:XP_012770040.1 hypothetical protein BBBOND_0403420 [Babesia bigemina]
MGIISGENPAIMPIGGAIGTGGTMGMGEEAPAHILGEASAASAAAALSATIAGSHGMAHENPGRRLTICSMSHSSSSPDMTSLPRVSDAIVVGRQLWCVCRIRQYLRGTVGS